MGILRVIFALSVVIEHIHALPQRFLLGGRLAVELFFIISGFYMALVLNTKYLKSSNGIRAFFAARALRIFPIYWMILFLTLVASAGSFLLRSNWGALQPFSEYKNTLPVGPMIGFILANVIIIGQDVLLFLGFDQNMNIEPVWQASNNNVFPYDFMMVPQMWSVSLELMFYAIAPFILKRSRIKFLIFVFLASCTLKAILILGPGASSPWDYRFFPAELCYFLGGALACHAYLNGRLTSASKLLSKAILGSWMIGIIIYPLFPNRQVIDIFYLVAMMLSVPSIFKLTKNSSLDSAIGELSYPIYLVHLLAIWILQLGLGLSPYQTMASVLPITLLSGYLIVRFVERPLDKYRHGLATRIAK